MRGGDGTASVGRMAGWRGGEIAFRVAEVHESGEVLRVLDEAAGWLHRRGITQWSERFEPAWIEGALVRGETWLVTVDGVVSATVTLDWSDPTWHDLPGPAGYVHRLAVRRTMAGLGAVVLDWVGTETSRRGRSALRLDCVASNQALRAYYEAAGFVHRGDVGVKGRPALGRSERPTVIVSRYERALAT